MCPDGPEQFHSPGAPSCSSGSSLPPVHQTGQTPFGEATALQGTGGGQSSPSALPCQGTGPSGHLGDLVMLHRVLFLLFCSSHPFPASRCHSQSSWAPCAHPSCLWGGCSAVPPSPPHTNTDPLLTYIPTLHTHTLHPCPILPPSMSLPALPLGLKVGVLEGV